MIGEHTAQESDSGVSLLKNFGCLHLLGEEFSGANSQYKGVLGLIVLLLGGTLDDFLAVSLSRKNTSLSTKSLTIADNGCSEPC